MGIKRHERKREISRRRHRQKKLANLRNRLRTAKGDERKAIVEKMKKISPQANFDDLV